jgi:cytochrome c-type biogenesis protein CcmE
MRFSDFTVRKLALAISLLGIAVLFAIDYLNAPEEIRISEIQESMVFQRVKTKGIVEWRHFAKNTLLFEIQDLQKIKAVLFNPSKKELSEVNEKKLVEITGKIQKYKGELEIVVERVNQID